MSKWIFTALLFFLFGCSNAPVREEGFDYPALDIQKALNEVFPEGIGFVDSTQRVLYSKPFSITEGKQKVMLIARAIIIGDERPYTLVVDIRKIFRSISDYKSSYEISREYKGNKSLAKRMIYQVEQRLSKRRDEKNLFDDFKPF